MNTVPHYCNIIVFPITLNKVNFIKTHQQEQKIKETK